MWAFVHLNSFPHRGTLRLLWLWRGCILFMWYCMGTPEGSQPTYYPVLWSHYLSTSGRTAASLPGYWLDMQNLKPHSRSTELETGARRANHHPPGLYYDPLVYKSLKLLSPLSVTPACELQPCDCEGREMLPVTVGKPPALWALLWCCLMLTHVRVSKFS